MNRTVLGVFGVCVCLLVVGCGGGKRRGGRGDAGPRDGAVGDGGGGCVEAEDCDDGVPCTENLCSSGFCVFRPVHARCSPGESCDPEMGCMGGRPCGTDADCEDDDPCTTFERCDPASRTCRSEPLDGDGDGDPPRVCGGTDCDDSEWLVHGSGTEECDGLDNDCDGTVDGPEAEETCEGDRVCSALGFCDCPDGLRDCGEASCTDISSDPDHCGGCFRECPAAATCAGGSCVCPSGQTHCGASCVDTATDELHCGACGRLCGSGQTCIGGTCTCAGGLTACGSSCVDTATDELNCGSCGRTCPSVQTCISGVCRCPSGRTLCGSSCVDTATDESHCGGCFDPCASDETCVSGVCAGICYEGGACTTEASCGPTGVCIPESTRTYTPVVGLPSGGTSVPVTEWNDGYCADAYGTIGDTGTCTPGEVGAAAGCSDCGKCLDLGTTAACFDRCTRSNGSRGGCRVGYACDLDYGVCLPDCFRDLLCRIRREDTDGNGVIDASDSYVHDPASDAICSFTTGRCTHSGTTGAVAGDACARSSDCEADGICGRHEGGWPGGYCTKQACELTGRSCAGAGSICHPRLYPDSDASYCLKGCTVGAEPAGDRLGPDGHGAGCRAGYRCFWDGATSSGTNGGCIPGNYNAVTVNNVGAACADDADCYSPFGAGRCVAFPGNACTIIDCAAPGMPAGVCGTGNQCVVDGDVSFCLEECVTSTDCRSGYTCYDHDTSSGTPRVCYPT